MNKEPLLLEEEFDAPIELVWRAITEKELLSKWYFDVSDFKPEVGHKFHFEGGAEDKRYMHLCEVIEVIPGKKLKYSWTYEGHTGVSFVTFQLSTNGNTTKLKLIHEGLETFTNPDFIRDNFVEGWNYLIQESLKEYLKNGKGLRTW